MIVIAPPRRASSPAPTPSRSIRAPRWRVSPAAGRHRWLVSPGAGRQPDPGAHLAQSLHRRGAHRRGEPAAAADVLDRRRPLHGPDGRPGLAMGTVAPSRSTPCRRRPGQPRGRLAGRLPGAAQPGGGPPAATALPHLPDRTTRPAVAGPPGSGCTCRATCPCNPLDTPRDVCSTDLQPPTMVAEGVDDMQIAWRVPDHRSGGHQRLVPEPSRPTPTCGFDLGGLARCHRPPRRLDLRGAALRRLPRPGGLHPGRASQCPPCSTASPCRRWTTWSGR